MEGYGASTYGDRFADVYDEWYPPDEHSTQAVMTLADLADPPGPVLELGIGTGKLALPLCERGFDVRGIDASPRMLDRLRTKPGGDRIAVTLGDLASVSVPRRPTDPDSARGRLRCSLVFAASNTIFGLLSAQAQAECFARVADALRPGGRFVVEAFVPPEDDQDVCHEDVSIRSMTAEHLVLSAARRDPVHQTISGHFVDLRDGSITLRPYHLRYAGISELDAMAAAAQLELEYRWAGWSREPFTAESTDHVSVWRRP
jgi:SAM-dependent methyltransferase